MAEPGVGHRNQTDLFSFSRLDRFLPLPNNTLQFKPKGERDIYRFATSNSRLGDAALTDRRAIGQRQIVPAYCRVLEPRPTKDPPSS